MARLARKNGRYWLAIVPCDFVEFPLEVMRAKAATTTPEWPHAFARLGVPPGEFLSNYPCNHIHGITGTGSRSCCTSRTSWASKRVFG